ncbi:MAG: cellulase family glycosylhydrolase [Verrucomicrobiota bacterium]
MIAFPALRSSLKTVFGTLLVLGLLVGGISAQDRVPAWPEPVIPKPIGLQLKESNKTTENIEQIHELGVNWVRRGFLWGNVEKKKGDYSGLERYDQLVKDVEERGMKLLICLALGNKKLYPHVRTKEGREAFAKYAAAVAERYKDKDFIMYEIWNEPNVTTFWGKHGKHNSKQFAQEYYNLVKATVPAIRAVKPNAVILGGSVSNMWEKSYEWQNFCFELGILETGIDGWSVHPYGVQVPEQYIEAYNIVRDMMVKHGGPRDFPMVNTERGFPTRKDKEGWAGGDEKTAFDRQAWHLVRQYLIDIYTGIKYTIWYEWEGKSNTNKKGRTKSFVLINNGEKMPAYFSLQHMNQALNGYRLKERLELESETDFALLFENGEGKQKVVAWCAPEKGAAPGSQKAHDVSIPVTGSTATVTDLFGKNSQDVKVAGGRLKVEISGSPIYIALN